MKDWIKSAVNDFEAYVNSFTGLTPEQQNNFTIKKDHSLRVTDNTMLLSAKLGLNDFEEKAVVLAAVFHDIGRFRQIAEFNTLNDASSADHAQIAVEVLKENNMLGKWNDGLQEVVYRIILVHNKFELPSNLPEQEMMLSRVLRDADKLDIYKVLSDYYSSKNSPPNHMLTWEMVSKKEVKNEADVKILQMSWVYDINYKYTVGQIFRNRYLEKIYDSLPKNDPVIEIYRKVKVYAENKMME
jgi:putative nucleotidyltransferase with HDIG domain